MLTSLAQQYGFDVDKPFEDLAKNIQDLVLNGSGKEKIRFLYVGERGNKYQREHPFEGILPNLERRYRETDSVAVRETRKHLASQPRPDCNGTIAPRSALCIRGRQTDIRDQRHAAQPGAEIFHEVRSRAAARLRTDRPQIGNRLQFLVNAASTTSRSTVPPIPSGGEAQRIRLASQIGSA
jgi:excinuclease ABC subunit A